MFLLACSTGTLTLGDDTARDVPPVVDTAETGVEQDSGPSLERVGDAPADTAPEEPEDVPDILFEEGQVLPLSLELERDAEWDVTRGDWGTASLVYEDRTWTVAIRIKGSSTVTDFSDKPSLIVDVNRVVLDQEFMGHKRFNLHNQIIDPSMMSEVMSYRYLRDAGLPASRAGFVRLTINGEDYGLYTAVEAINDDFLERWFADPNGNLYENGWQDCDFDDVRCFEEEEVDEGNDDALRVLADAVESDDWEAQLRTQLDWELFIRSLAMDALIAHWDGYAYDRSNYHLYHDPTADQWTFLPQSMDLDYGWRPWSYPTCGRYGVDPGDYTEGMLGALCLESDTCRAEYVAELLRLNDEFEAADPVGRVDELYALIADEVRSDDHRHYSYSDFESHVACVRDWVEQRPAEIRAWAAEEG